jgi:hypothetical protein
MPAYFFMNVRIVKQEARQKLAIVVFIAVTEV